MKKALTYLIFAFVLPIASGLFFTAPDAYAISCTCACMDVSTGASRNVDIEFSGSLENDFDFSNLDTQCGVACLGGGTFNVVGASCSGGIEYVQKFCNPCACSCLGTCSPTGYVDYPSASYPGVPLDQSMCESTCRSFCADRGSGCSYDTATCTSYGGYTIPGISDVSPGAPTSPTTPVPERVELDPPFGQAGESGDVFIQEIIGVLINWFLGIVGSIALLMFVIGGFIWLTSAGSPDRIKTGKNILVWSVLGLAVIFASYAITRVILEAILG